MRKLAKKVGVGAGAMVVAVKSASAAVPAEVETAIANMKVDAVVVASLVLVALITVFAIKFMRKGL